MNKDNDQTQKKGRSILLILLLLFGIGLAFCLLFPKPKADSEKDPLKVGSGVAVSQEPKEEKKDEYIEIPTYHTLAVDSRNPNIYLNNPEINDVYFQYKVTLKGDGTVLYDNEEVLEPGKAFEVNVYDMLDPGTYTVTIGISTFDMETEAACNGATQEAELVIAK